MSRTAAATAASVQARRKAKTWASINDLMPRVDELDNAQLAAVLWHVLREVEQRRGRLTETEMDAAIKRTEPPTDLGEWT